jgi:hypothetical protein
MRTIRASTLGVAALVLAVASAVATTAQSPPGEAAGTTVPGSAASPMALPDGDLEAGTTYFLDDLWDVGSADLILTVPATGRLANGGGNLYRDLIADPVGPAFAEVLITPWWRARNLTADPCHWRNGGELDPPVGPTADDLATALVEQAAGNASAPTDVTVGGYPGKRVELSIPVGLDIATCDGGEFSRWWDEFGTERGGWMYPDGRNIVYILDVGGTRAVIDTLYKAGTSEADLAEAEQLIASMRFEWPARPTPNPSPST